MLARKQADDMIETKPEVIVSNHLREIEREIVKASKFGQSHIYYDLEGAPVISTEALKSNIISILDKNGYKVSDLGYTRIVIYWGSK